MVRAYRSAPGFCGPTAPIHGTDSRAASWRSPAARPQIESDLAMCAWMLSRITFRLRDGCFHQASIALVMVMYLLCGQQPEFVGPLRLPREFRVAWFVKLLRALCCVMNAGTMQ